MKHLIRSFESHQGLRGCHFYNDTDCTFLPWNEVLTLLDNFPREYKNAPFGERLMESVANYDPTNQYLAVCQVGDKVTVELFLNKDHVEI